MTDLTIAIAGAPEKVEILRIPADKLDAVRALLTEPAPEPDPTTRYRLDDSMYGATRDYFSRQGRIHWRNAGGDWTDAEGTQQGDVPFAVGQPADVSALLEDWTGITLRPAAGGWTQIMGRESDSPPILTVDGVELLPTADVQIDMSTGNAIGPRPAMVISGKANILLDYDIPAGAKTAVLTWSQSRGTAEVAVFKTRRPPSYLDNEVTA